MTKATQLDIESVFYPALPSISFVKSVLQIRALQMFGRGRGDGNHVLERKWREQPDGFMKNNWNIWQLQTGASASCNFLYLPPCFVLSHKIVNSVGKKWRKTTSPVSICVRWLAESHDNLWETVEKGFHVIFVFSFFSCSINIWSIWTKFSSVAFFLPNRAHVLFSSRPALSPGASEHLTAVTVGVGLGTSVWMWSPPLNVLVFLSPSFTALRSRSGRSIINGNWAIDRPGRYEGGGTMFTYKRPNEISSTAGESFLADGPTNEVLDVYVSFLYLD